MSENLEAKFNAASSHSSADRLVGKFMSNGNEIDCPKLLIISLCNSSLPLSVVFPNDEIGKTFPDFRDAEKSNHAYVSKRLKRKSRYLTSPYNEPVKERADLNDEKKQVVTFCWSAYLPP